MELSHDLLAGPVSPLSFGDVALGDSFVSFPSFGTCAKRCFFVGNGSSSFMELLDRFCEQDKEQITWAASNDVPQNVAQLFVTSSCYKRYRSFTIINYYNRFSCIFTVLSF